MLKNIASEVTIVHRRDKFRAHEHSVEKLYDSDIKVITSKVITNLDGDTHIEKVTVADPKTGEGKKL